MKAYVVIECHEGFVDDVRASLDENIANSIEKELCEKYNLPYDWDERVSAMLDRPDDREVTHYIIELE